MKNKKLLHLFFIFFILIFSFQSFCQTTYQCNYIKADCYPQWEQGSRATVLIFFPDSNYCSGTLVANKSDVARFKRGECNVEDITPYIISAGHCFKRFDRMFPDEKEDFLKRTRIYFNFKTGCNDPNVTGNIKDNLNFYPYITGIHLLLLEFNRGYPQFFEDFSLLQLRSGIPASYAPGFMGLKAIPYAAAGVYNVSHPEGLEKQLVWGSEVEFLKGDNEHVDIDTRLTIMEFEEGKHNNYGSSGSGLFTIGSTQLMIGNFTAGLREYECARNGTGTTIKYILLRGADQYLLSQSLMVASGQANLNDIDNVAGIAGYELDIHELGAADNVEYNSTERLNFLSSAFHLFPTPDGPSAPEASFTSPVIKIPYTSPVDPFTLTASDNAKIVWFTGQLINEGAGENMQDKNLKLLTWGSNAQLDINIGKLNAMTGIHHITALNNDASRPGSHIRYTQAMGDLRIGADEDGYSFYIGHNSTVEIILKDPEAKLYIEGGVMGKGNGTLIINAPSGTVYFNTSHSPSHSYIQGSLQVKCKDFICSGKTYIENQGTSARIWATGKVEASGRWVATKGGQIFIWTRDKLDAAMDWMADKTGSKIDISFTNRNISKINTKMRQSGPAEQNPLIWIHKVNSFDSPKMPMPNSFQCTTSRNKSKQSEKVLYALWSDALYLNKHEVKYSVYPNPFANQLNIQFNLTEPSAQMLLEVYDMKGQLVHRQTVQKLNKGNHNIRWNSSSAASGIYLLRLIDQNGKTMIQQKAMKL